MTSYLKYAQTGLVPATNPITDILDHLEDGWIETAPPASQITFGRRFSDLSKNYAVIVKHMQTTSVEQILGAARHRFNGKYKVHVVSKGTSAQNAVDFKFAIENEIRRIIKTSVTGLQSVGYDLVRMNDDFVEVETGDESQANKGIAGDYTFLVRSVATITLTYDLYVA